MKAILHAIGTNEFGSSEKQIKPIVHTSFIKDKIYISASF